MKSKGFTLIELLAVIVILAIIALIATPIVLNIIKDSKNSSMMRGAEYYLDAVELGVARAKLDNIAAEDGKYNILDMENICLEGSVSNCTEVLKVDVSGEILNSGKITITDWKITNTNLTYGEKTVIKYDNELVLLPTAVSFEKDSWSTIIANVKLGNTDKYEIGETREIELDGYENGETDENGNQIKTYTVRLANKSNDDPVCSTEGYSQTACGFVIEFVDIITTRAMNNTDTSTGGWQ